MYLGSRVGVELAPVSGVSNVVVTLQRALLGVARGLAWPLKLWVDAPAPRAIGSRNSVGNAVPRAIGVGVGKH
eukprot:608058-Prorocentrum_minimum.AAC.4